MTDDPDSPSRPDTPSISIAVTILTPAWREALSEAGPMARRAASAALVAADMVPDRDAEVSLALADDNTVAKLNLEYRGIDGATNVLSFADREIPAHESGGPLLLGDVVLAYETVRREAEEQGKRFSDHLCHLVVHGVLHLLGHEHRTEAQAAAMERLEAAALAGLGISDPYVLAVGS